ncbi:ATP-binding protein [Streptomyces monticola]|uniref:histidine kinase n=1 Tax=Streptomyces monticola TaxID=2666263 RepID=A0ABW2JDJ3_9ACTN
MSHLREPAARADRREGGRHGRPGPRAAQHLPETHIRRQLFRTAVLPAVAVALCGAAAVLFTLRSTGVRPTPELWAVLTGAATVAAAGIGAAAVSADRSARAILDRLAAFRRNTARSQADLRGLVEQLRRGEGVSARRSTTPPRAVSGDEFDQLAHELTRAHDIAVASVVQASQLSSHAGSEQKVEVFVNLARRLQSLVHREIQLLDELENEVEDPELLKGLFHVDHLATRIRRHAENLAVLGGAISRRQWSNPVTMTEVLRSSIAEVEQYSRVKLVPPIDGTLRGHAVADVIHLLAELVENASVFSAPHTQVLLRASHVTAGLAVEVEDRGLGMPVTEQNKMNALLSDPDQVNVASLLSDGRIGLFVVSALARRHGIAVRLQTNIYGGVQAVIVLPQGLLGADSQAATDEAKQAKEGQQGQQGQQAEQAQQAQQAQQAVGAAESESAATATAPAPAPEQLTAPPAAVPEPAQLSRSADAPALTLHTAAPTHVAHVPQQPARDEAPAGVGGAAPLPVRGAHEERPTPADAVPGIRPGERAAAEGHSSPQSGGLPGSAGPSGPAVRGTMGRPQLPKRRAQEHLVPQLRDAPAAPPQDDGHLVGHDPGLMAAFQRGIGMAEGHGDPQQHHSQYDQHSQNGQHSQYGQTSQNGQNGQNGSPVPQQSHDHPGAEDQHPGTGPRHAHHDSARHGGAEPAG